MITAKVRRGYVVLLVAHVNDVGTRRENNPVDSNGDSVPCFAFYRS